MTPPATSGLVIVDKPAEWTSHDVVAKLRGLAGTRRVGHAGTLDPMATGVLVVGVQKATRLLGHLALTEKVYEATIRLGQSTNTDDAEGEITATAPPGAAAAVTSEALAAGIAALTGEIQQVPPQVSAIRVDGRRAYRLARKGEGVALKARPVTVSDFSLGEVRRHGELVDLDASITCSSGTYIRALARDLGAALGTGGHLTALRRTRVGPYDLSVARTIDQLTERCDVLPIGDAAAAAFPSRALSDEEAETIAHGGRLPALGQGPGPVAAFAPDGTFVALVEEHSGAARPVAVFAPR